MNKICTSVEQSKKLIELGININTADMIYYWFGNFELNDEWYELHLGTNKVNDKDIPAWSLSALFDLFPNGSILRKSDKGKYFIFGNMFDNPLDAAFEMVCWLKENGKI